MTFIKRIFAVIGILLGTIGFILCLAVIVGAWWVNGPITDGLLSLFPPIEAALEFGDTTAEQFGLFLGDTSARLEEAADVQPLATALEDEIGQVAIYVDVANGLVGSAEETITDVTTSFQANGNQQAALAVERLAGQLDEVNTTLNSVEALTSDVSDGRLEVVDELANGLASLEETSREVQDAIGQTQTEVNEIKISIPRWIDIGSLIVTLIFLWFGIAQFLLLRQSWFLLIAPRRVKAARS